MENGGPQSDCQPPITWNPMARAGGRGSPLRAIAPPARAS